MIIPSIWSRLTAGMLTEESALLPKTFLVDFCFLHSRSSTEKKGCIDYPSGIPLSRTFADLLPWYYTRSVCHWLRFKQITLACCWLPTPVFTRAHSLTFCSTYFARLGGDHRVSVLRPKHLVHLDVGAHTFIRYLHSKLQLWEEFSVRSRRNLWASHCICSNTPWLRYQGALWCIHWLGQALWKLLFILYLWVRGVYGKWNEIIGKYSKNYLPGILRHPDWRLWSQRLGPSQLGYCSASTHYTAGSRSWLNNTSWSDTFHWTGICGSVPIVKKTLDHFRFHLARILRVLSSHLSL